MCLCSRNLSWSVQLFVASSGHLLQGTVPLFGEGLPWFSVMRTCLHHISPATPASWPSHHCSCVGRGEGRRRSLSQAQVPEGMFPAVGEVSQQRGESLPLASPCTSLQQTLTAQRCYMNSRERLWESMTSSEQGAQAGSLGHVHSPTQPPPDPEGQDPI